MRVAVRFICHSGFEVTAGRHTLIFDAAMGKEPLDAIRRAQQPVVFASHAHGDHYNPRIFAWRNLNPAIRYIISDDIPTQQDAVRIRPGGIWQADGLSVQALASTDAGVAFLVETDGVRLFHAGDLNDWHWKDQSTAAEVEVARSAFLEILSGIRSNSVDIAFFPVDPRMGADYDEGARYFCRQVKPAHFFPMHFGRRFDIPATFQPWAKGSCPDVMVHDILREGQTDEIDLQEVIS